MNRHTSVLLKNSREMKRRHMHRTRNFIKRDTLAHLRREIRLRSFRPLSMIHVCTFAFRAARDTVLDESRLEHVRDELQRGNISPQRLQRIRLSRLEPLHELAMAPEHTTVTRPGKKSERLLRMIVYRGIELAHDVVEHTRRNSEDRAAIAAIGWVTDAISRRAREEHCLVHIGCCCAASEVTRKCTMTHQHDIIRVRFFFRPRSTLCDVAAVIMHADNRALVERPVHNIFFALVTHKCYRT